MKNRIRSLEGLRVVAIFIIVLSHFEFVGTLNNGFGSIYNNFLHNATLGVDYFFVLSGFGLMLSFLRNYNKKEGNYSENPFLFAFRRVKKLYPLVLISFIPYVISSIVLFVLDGFSIKSLIKLLAQILVSPTLLQSASGTTIFSHALNGVIWFYSCLFIIYLVSPLLMTFVFKHKDNKLFLTLGAFLCVLLIVFFSFAFSFVDGIWIFDDFVYGSPYVRVFFVALGMFIGALCYKILGSFVVTNGLKVVTSFLEIILLLCCVAWFLFRNSVPISQVFLLRIIDVPLIASLIFVFSFEAGIFSKFFSTGFFVWQSKFVPYIYIIHYPVRIVLMTYVLRTIELSTLSAFICCVCIILLTLLLVCIYILIQKHLLKKQNGINSDFKSQQK